jgi:hypothetical protein
MSRLLAVICVALFAIAQTPNNQGAAKKYAAANAYPSSNSENAEHKSTDATYTIANQTIEAQRHEDKTQQSGDDIEIQRQLAKFTKYLVWVGAAQALILAGTLLLIWRQANLMKTHAVHFDKLAGTTTSQADLMSKQLTELKTATDIALIAAEATVDNAKAAKKVAETSAKNIELYIGKERARLRIELKPLVFPAKPEYSHSVDFTVSIHGPSDAFITESLCTAYYFPPQVIAQPDLAVSVMMPINPLPSVITANSPPVDCYAFLGFNDASYKVIVDEIKAKNFIVGIRGFIKYKDVFGGERETAFRYVWQYTDVMYGLGEQYGGWVQQNPDENRET